MENKKNIAILGSTGSIGTQTLDIIANYPDKFKATVLTANHNWQLLVQQAKKFKPSTVVIADRSFYQPTKEALKDTNIRVKSGPEDIAEVVTNPDIDMVLTAMVGYSGLIPTIEAIKAGKTIALANKETLVVAGDIISKLAKNYNTKIIPVDSEHSAIFQCLIGEKHEYLRKIILTASGGPFRELTRSQLENVSVKEALKHPNWNMGAKVTIDSASMMNKGFEMIEAKWLFNCEPKDINILIHPQSIVHSMVEFQDGSIKAQLGIPDMHIPIQYALGFPQRLKSERFILDWGKLTQLSFEEPDYEKFPLLRMAYTSIEKGGNMPCILNAANEVAVKSFLDGKIKFTQMAEMVRFTLENTPFIKEADLHQLIYTNDESRKIAFEWLETHC